MPVMLGGDGPDGPPMPDDSQGAPGSDAGVMAAQAFLAAVKSGDAQGLFDAFEEMLGASDDKADAQGPQSGLDGAGPPQ